MYVYMYVRCAHFWHKPDMCVCVCERVSLAWKLMRSVYFRTHGFVGFLPPRSAPSAFSTLSLAGVAIRYVTYAPRVLPRLAKRLHLPGICQHLHAKQPQPRRQQQPQLQQPMPRKDISSPPAQAYKRKHLSTVSRRSTSSMRGFWPGSQSGNLPALPALPASSRIRPPNCV